jgi:hypothetical protein
MNNNVIAAVGGATGPALGTRRFGQNRISFESIAASAARTRFLR